MFESGRKKTQSYSVLFFPVTALMSSGCCSVEGYNKSALLTWGQIFGVKADSGQMWCKEAVWKCGEETKSGRPLWEESSNAQVVKNICCREQTVFIVFIIFQWDFSCEASVQFHSLCTAVSFEKSITSIVKPGVHDCFHVKEHLLPSSSHIDQADHHQINLCISQYTRFYKPVSMTFPTLAHR